MTSRAYHLVILPDGTRRPLAIVDTDDAGHLLQCRDLRAEEPFVEWMGGTLDLQKPPEPPAEAPKTDLYQ